MQIGTVGSKSTQTRMIGIRATVYPCNSKLVSTIVYPLHNSCIIHIVLQFKLAIAQNDTALTASTLYSVVISLWLDCISGQWRPSPIMYKPADYVSQNKYISVLIERLALKWRRPRRCAIKMQGENFFIITYMYMRPRVPFQCTGGPVFDSWWLPGVFNVDEMKDLWCSSTAWPLSTQVWMEKSMVL